MKKNSLIIFSLLLVSLVCSSFQHPLKLTTSLIQYNSEEKNMSIECRVFIDDFQKTINRPEFDLSNPSIADVAAIELYFEEYYRFFINNRKLVLNYKSSKVHSGSNVLSLKFLINNLSIKKGDALLIENELFFNEFGPLQSNKMTVRIPPFMAQGFNETTFHNISVSYQL